MASINKISLNVQQTANPAQRLAPLGSMETQFKTPQFNLKKMNLI